MAVFQFFVDGSLFAGLIGGDIRTPIVTENNIEIWLDHIYKKVEGIACSGSGIIQMKKK